MTQDLTDLLSRGRESWALTCARRSEARHVRWMDLVEVAVPELGPLVPHAGLGVVPSEWEWTVYPPAGAAWVISVQIDGLSQIRARFEYARQGAGKGKWSRVPWDVLGLDSRRYMKEVSDTEWAVVRHGLHQRTITELPRGEWWYVPDIATALAAAEAAWNERQALAGELDNVRDLPRLVGG